MQHALELGARFVNGADRQTPRRELLQKRYVEIPVNHHREASWNGRRRHHEQIAAEAFLAKLGPLEHAEAVLLVDDGEAELLERDALLDERMRSYNEMHVSARELLEKRLALRSLQSRAEKRHPVTGGLEKLADIREMLLGKKLRWHHESDLSAAFHDDDGGEDAHHGLSRADITLDEASHRHVARELVGNRLQDVALRRGQTKRKDLADDRANLIVHGEDARFCELLV